jgi:FkbM family methyltransferase
MKIPFKKFINAYKSYTKPLLANKQSWFFRPLYLAYDLFFKRHGNLYFSGFGEDVVLKNIFHRKKVGFYVDIGCWHPKWLSNTYLLHRKGWKGINIDMDAFKIDMFNIARKNDINVCTAVSDEEKDLTYYCSKDHSAMNTLDPEFARAATANKQGLNYELRKTKSTTLDNIISATKYAKTEIDLLSIDVEGHELPVLRSLDFETYKPKVVVVELHTEKIEEILKCELYKFMKGKRYSLYSWIQLSLLFVRDGYLKGSAVVPFPEESTSSRTETVN